MMMEQQLRSAMLKLKYPGLSILSIARRAHPGRGNTESTSDPTIDPGPLTLNGPDQIGLFDTGEIRFSGAPVIKIPLGEIRTDNDNHLLVLGGFGKSASPAGTALDGYF